MLNNVCNSRCRNRMSTLVVAGLLLASAFPLSGCGSGSGIERVVIEGHVTLDGKPVEYGQIMFYPTGTTVGPVAGGEIQKGVYKANSSGGVVVGTNKVGIIAYVPKFPNRPPDPEGPEMINAAPEKYAGPNSEIERTITAETSTLDFDLKSN